MTKVEVGQLAKGQIVEFVIVKPNKKVVRAKIVKIRKITTDLVDVNDGSMWMIDSESLVAVKSNKLKKLQKKVTLEHEFRYNNKREREI